MFYSKFILNSQGPLGVVWHAAHWDVKKNVVNETQIDKKVEYIVSPAVPIALRTCGHLLVGVVKIYSRKAKYLLNDASDALSKIKVAFRPGTVDMPENQQTVAANAITLADKDVNSIGNLDLDQALLEVGLNDYIGNSDLITAADHDITLHEALAAQGIDEEDITGGLNMDSNDLDMDSNMLMAGDMNLDDLNDIDLDLEIEAGRDAGVETSYRPEVDESLDLSMFDNSRVAVDEHGNKIAPKGKEKAGTSESDIEMPRDAQAGADISEINDTGKANGEINLDLDMGESELGLDGAPGDFNLDMDLDGAQMAMDDVGVVDMEANPEDGTAGDGMTRNGEREDSAPQGDAAEFDVNVSGKDSVSAPPSPSTRAHSPEEEDAGLDHIPLPDTSMVPLSETIIAQKAGTAAKRKARKRQKGVIFDEETVLSAEQMRTNLNDVSELINTDPTDQMVPYTRKGRQAADLEYRNRPEHVLHVPSTTDLPPVLRELVTRNLRHTLHPSLPKRAADDLSDEEEEEEEQDMGTTDKIAVDENAPEVPTATEPNSAVGTELSEENDIPLMPEMDDDLMPMEDLVPMDGDEPSPKRIRLDGDEAEAEAEVEGQGQVVVNEDGVGLDLSLDVVAEGPNADQEVPAYVGDEPAGFAMDNEEQVPSQTAQALTIESSEAQEARDEDEYEAATSKRTETMIKHLQANFKVKEQLKFSDLTQGQSKRTAAAAFFEILNLTTRHRIDVSQKDAYADFTITSVDLVDDTLVQA